MRGVAIALHADLRRARPRSRAGRPRSARRRPRRRSPRGGAASSCPGSARSTASGRAATRARPGPGVAFFRAAIARRAARPAPGSPCGSRPRSAGTVLRKSVLSKVVVSSILPVRKPLPSGLNGTNPMPSSSQRRQDLRLGLAPPQRVLALQRRDRLDGVRAADRLHAGLGQAEVLDLALADQFLHRAGHVLDRHVRIDAVLVEQVDAVGPQPLERRLDHLAGCARAGCPAPPGLPFSIRSRTWWRSPPGRGPGRAPRRPAPRS